MLYFHCVKSVNEGVNLVRELKNDYGLRSLLTTVEGQRVVITEFNSTKMCERITKIVNGVEYDINFGRLYNDEIELIGWNDLPFVTSDFADKDLSFGEVSGRFTKAEQLKMFGRYFGKMLIILDFGRKTLYTVRSVCFGTDRDIQSYPFAELGLSH